MHMNELNMNLYLAFSYFYFKIKHETKNNSERNGLIKFANNVFFLLIVLWVISFLSVFVLGKSSQHYRHGFTFHRKYIHFTFPYCIICMHIRTWNLIDISLFFSFIFISETSNGRIFSALVDFA